MHLFASDDNRCATQEVASGNDTVLCQNQHRARALDFAIHHVDAFHERTSHIDEQCHEFRLIQVVGTLLTQMHALCQEFIGNLAQVVDLRHGNHRIATQVRVDDDGLWVGVADDTQALIACKFVEFVFKL